MEICGHCHNVLPKTVDRCTVCGTARVDPTAADVRRREDGEQPSHAPGWAAPAVPDTGIHPDDFLRELSGEAPATPAAAPSPDAQDITPALPPRAVPATPAPGALAGYLGTTADRRPTAPDEETSAAGEATQSPPSPQPPTDPSAATQFAQHLSTATRVAPDGVAARTTRLDGTVKLGPTSSHRILTLGAPLLAGVLLIGGVLGSYQVRTSQAQEVEAANIEEQVEASTSVETSTAILQLDLDGCGVLGQTNGVLFADNTILVPRSSIITDNRPTVRAADGSEWTAEILGWSTTKGLAVVRTDDRMPGGLEWGVSSRVNADDAVTVLALVDGGAPMAATIAEARTLDGRNVSFTLDVDAPEGSVVLNAAGFVIGVIDDNGRAQVSDDIAPAVSRIVLANERPQAVCPAPATTSPPSTVPAGAEPTATGSEESAPEE